MNVRAWLLSTLAVAVPITGTGPARAQTAPPPLTAPPPAEAPVGEPGMRMVTGQAPVVGGNAAGARERALDDAVRQAVDQTLGELADPQTRGAHAKEVKALLAKARSFIPRYRTLEEGEVNGNYTLRLEVVVDELALRRRIERWSAGAAPTAPPVAAPQRVFLVAAERATPAAALVPALAVAFGAGRAVAAPEGVDPSPSGAIQAAARAGMARAALVSASVEDEGALRGVGRVAIACRATARLYAAPAATPVGERQAATRVFAEEPAAGRADCLNQLAAELRVGIEGALAAGPARPSGDMQVLTVDATLTEPAAVPALLKSLRALGAVSNAELHRVAGGHAELKIWTRSPPEALVAALSRDVDPMITLSEVRAAGDVVHLQARLRPPGTTGSPP
jgi:hypothetical protein